LATFWRLPVRALNRAVLPELGLPTRATRAGSAKDGLAAVSEAPTAISRAKVSSVEFHGDGAGLAATQGHAGVVDAHGDRIAPEQALVQHLDRRAFHEAHLQQASLEFLGRHGLGGAGYAGDLDDHALIAAPGRSQGAQAGAFALGGVELRGQHERFGHNGSD
jgi:hypothetical protein